MARIAVSLGDQSTELKLAAVRTSLAKFYGESEIAVFSVSDTRGTLPIESLLKFTTLNKTPPGMQAEKFAKRASGKVPEATVCVGVKTIDVQVNDEWVPVDIVVVLLKGSEIATMNLLGTRWNEIVKEVADETTISNERIFQTTLKVETHADKLISIIDLALGGSLLKPGDKNKIN